MILTPENCSIETPLDNTPIVFLGGTIDDGVAVDWQDEISKKFEDYYNNNIIVCNPRRKNWNKNATQTEMYNQIKWERHMQQNSSFILYNFLPGSVSPITLMELGEHKDKDCFVCCSPLYWKFENVALFCFHYNIFMHRKLDIVFQKICEAINTKYNI